MMGGSEWTGEERVAVSSVCSGVTLPNPAVRAGTDQGREAGRDREEEPQRGKGYRR